jgi:hypothetical protein
MSETTTATGEVVEFTLSWGRDHMWCGGRWPATLLAEMEAANNAG